MPFYSDTRAAFGECPLCPPRQRRFEPCRRRNGTRRYLQYGCGDPYWIACPNCCESGGRDICAHGLWQWHSAALETGLATGGPGSADPNPGSDLRQPSQCGGPAEATIQTDL